MKYLYFLIMCFLPVIGVSADVKDDTPKHIIVGSKVQTESAQKLAKKYGMCVFGTGGAMMDSVKEMGIAFMVYRPLNKNEARALIVNCVNEFLEDINCHAELQPYLAARPFEARHIEMIIYSEVPAGKDVCYPYFSIISSCKGKIHYVGRISETDKHFKHEEEETFDEALKIVKRKV